MKQVFLYVRVSTEEQALHGLSIEAQTAALQAWAKANHHEIVDIYTDAGISARKPASKRPELQRLLVDVQAGKGELVVFTKLDRWFRSIAEYYKVQEILEAHHVDWRTIHEDYDTSTASGRLKINIMLSVAQDEADRTSERIKAVFEAKRQRLEALTGSCPLGYMQENKRFVKNPETEAGVSAFFETYLTTGSLAAAMDKSKECGVRLNYDTAYRMLENPCYYGTYHGMDGMTPAYISREEFEKVKSLRKRIVRKTTKNRVYIFSGLITCGECGSRMGGRVNTRCEALFYDCNAHYGKRSDCPNNVNMAERKIERHLLSTVNRRMAQLKVQAEKICAAQKTRDYKGEIASLRHKLGKLKDLYMTDLISLDECKSESDVCKQKIETLEQEAKKVREPDLSALEKELTLHWKQVYGESDRETKRDFWRAVLKEIRIYKDRHIEYDFNVNF